MSLLKSNLSGNQGIINRHVSLGRGRVKAVYGLRPLVPDPFTRSSASRDGPWACRVSVVMDRCETARNPEHGR